MRQLLRPALVTGALLAAALLAAAGKPPGAVPVRAQGCVESGAESGCLLLLASTGTSYELHFRGPRPAAGTAISLDGTLLDGASTCMEGRPLQVTHWKRLDRPCPSEPVKPR